MCATCGCEGVVHDHDGEGHHDHDHDHDHHHDHDHDGGDHAQGHDDHDHPTTTIRLEHAVLGKNRQFAAANRALFERRGIFAIDLLGGPGAGKTALLVRYLRDKGVDERVSVVEGDLATANDADRIAAAGAPVVQINTGAVCHLDAHMVGHALESLEVEEGGTLFVENVGNLVCPAMFELGAHERVVVFSITEGEDKPLKYPHMFACATAVVLTKMDLLPHLDVDLQRAVENVRKVCPRATILRVSARSGEGMAELRAWVQGRAAAARAVGAAGSVTG